jgi:hypothetical protein
MSDAAPLEGEDTPKRPVPHPPSGRFTFEVTGHTKAPLEAVWPLVGLAERWKEWAWMTRTFLVEQGRDDPQGVGALRRFAVGPFGSTEEVVAWEPPHHLAYVAHKGLPVRAYRADVRLAEDAAGTTVSWSGSLDPLVPWSGTVVLAYVRGLVSGFTRRLCSYADNRTEPRN